MRKTKTIGEICSDLRRLLNQAVRRSLLDEHVGILLSGGLDTSIIAAISSKYLRPKAYTVALKEAPAPDIKYSVEIANKFGLEHKIHYLDRAEVIALIPLLVKVLHTFDPMEIRNSLTVYAGMLAAKDDGIKVIITGDGSDELMAGYSFFFSMSMERLDFELKRLWSVMSFSSMPLAESLGMAAKNPFLDSDFKSYAMSLDSKYKVGKHNKQIYGKWILRKAFESELPPEIIWREKTPIEFGSGTTILPRLFDSMISESAFSKKRDYYLEKDGVKIRDKEQLVYYEFYRSILGAPRRFEHGKTCPQCNSSVSQDATFCRICGAYPI